METEQGGDRPVWHALAGNAVVRELGVTTEGLDSDEAGRRLAEYGPNAMEHEQQRPWWRRLLGQFNNVLIIILLVAGTVSAALGAWVDAGAIFAVVIINAVIGFVQEGKAEKALESIKAMLSPQASVRRDGKRKNLPAEQVVPGDIVIIESGDRVPADLRLLQARSLRTQEATLTGESSPVDKGTEPVAEDAVLADRQSMAYASTLVVQGQAEGVVVATARDTEIGRISQMIEEVEEIQTPLLRQLDYFGKQLAVVILTVATAMAVFGVWMHGRGWQEMFMAAVGLSVAAIPQGLPAVVTVTLALGVQAMARRNAIIRRLPAVETLGAVSVIFSDKTGTLTRNEMTVETIVLGDREIQVSGVGYAPEGDFEDDGSALDTADAPLLQKFLVAGTLCNDAALTRAEEGEWYVDGDPTEGALIVAAVKAGLDPDDLRRRHRRLDAIPFESERKYMATLDRMEASDSVVHVKGAPDVLLDMCDRVRSADGDSPLDQQHWQEQIETLSARGLRVLALAEQPAGERQSLDPQEEFPELILLGLVGMLDPPRERAIQAIQICVEAGIRVKMVTGDHLLTAQAIGEKVGLASAARALGGREIEQLSDQELADQVLDVNVFARASPADKLRLVEAVQARELVCAMTGDGVNDAPALKRADIGVAMGITGTEASKEAAEMVLADDNFASIVDAVEEGRKVYDNIKKTITFLLPTNGAESLAILAAVLLGTLLPITPVQILWVNMVTAVTLGLALAFEPGEADLMQRPPRNPRAPILDRFLIWRVLFVSVLLVAAIYGLFLWLRAGGVDIDLARSAAVNMLVMGEVVYLLNTRCLLTPSLSRTGLLGSRPAVIAIGLVIALQLFWTYAPPMQLLFGSAPLGATVWAIIIAAALIIFLAVEIEKAVWRRQSPQKDR